MGTVPFIALLLNIFYCLLRAFLHAGTAVSTLALVDGSHVVLNGNGSGRTILFADMTGDTSHLTVTVNGFAHVLGHAGNNLFCAVRNKVDEVSRADVDTLAAGLTFILIHYCHTIYDVDGIKLTYGYAGAAAKTAKGTSLGTAAGRLHLQTAVGNSVIFILLGSVLAVAVTVNIGNLFFRLNSLYAHNC